jgi:hypothetical protein
MGPRDSLEMVAKRHSHPSPGMEPWFSNSLAHSLVTELPNIFQDLCDELIFSLM